MDKRAAEQTETESIRLELESQRREQESLQGAQESREDIMASCDEEAQKGAIELLKTKAELFSQYRDAAEKGDLYLKPDYESAYKRCLRRNGIEQQ